MSKNKIAVLTGASGRLGPIWIETLTEMGIRTFPVDLSNYDIGDPDSCNNARLDAKLLFGETEYPTILINNAAIDNPPGSKASFFGNIKRILEVNLMGAVWMTEQFIEGMKKQGEGLIINVGSIMGNIGADWRNYPMGFEKPVGYNLSKAALVQFSRSLCTQYGRYGIRSVTIAFGPYDHVDLIDNLEDRGKWILFRDKFLRNVPLGRCISRESLKATMRFAIECPEVSGQQILVDGGYVSW